MDRMRLVTGRLAVALLVSSALLMTAGAGTGLAQDPAASGPAATQAAARVEFAAVVTGVQREHLAEATNLIIKPPNKHCQSGIESHSTDQEITFSSDLALVDAIAIDDPAWGDQHVVLLPQGSSSDFLMGQAPGGGVDMAPLLFMASTAFHVTRTFARPGTGVLPQAVDFTDPCAGGGEGGRTPTPPDCGERDFTANLAVLNPEPNKLLPLASIDSPDVEELYATCGGSVDMAVGQFASGDSGQLITMQAQPMPSIDQLSDTSISKFEVSGSAQGRQDELGVRTDSDYAWTLTLCRVVNGQPAC
jgi:hypothetical protein